MRYLDRHQSSRRRLAASVSAGLAFVLIGTGQAAVASPAVHSATPPAVTTIGESEAIAKAEATGLPVDVSAATTATSTLTANPTGSLTLTTTALPERKLVSGAWKELDDTLTTTADGRIAPALSTGDLRLSDGGDGPLATMSGGGRSLALTLPFTLPTPALDGSTATYSGVLPGVDLQVDADKRGGFSEVLVVADAAAAANPELAQLTMATTAQGITLAADSAGNVAGTDVNHETVVTAPAPTMWDSTTPAASAATVTAPGTRTKLDQKSGFHALSSTAGPGVAAHVAPVGVRLAGGKLTLTPSKPMLSSAKWPVYIDPTWSWGTAQNGYAVIDNSRPSDKFWRSSPSDQKDLQSGNDPDGGEVRRTLLNFGLDTSRLDKTAIISSATLNITETWSYNCTASNVDVYAPASTLSSVNAFWGAWANVPLGTRNAEVDTAHGHDSSCPAKGVGFNIIAGIDGAIAAGRKTQTFLIKAADEGSQSGWKRWNADSPAITVEYDHTPNKPAGLHTSPVTACSGTTVGDQDVKLYATVSDPDGDTVSENFAIKIHNSTPSTSGTITNVASGSASSPFTVKESWLKSVAGTTVTQFDWTVTVSQFGRTSDAAGCSFTYDANRPKGSPDVTLPTDAVIGKPATFTVSYQLEAGETTYPASYQYQLNGGAVVTVPADSGGHAAFTAVPMRTTNTITVTATSPGGNLGIDVDDQPFPAVMPAPAADGDLTGDGNPDLLATGGANGLPTGAWIVPGNGAAAAALNPVASDIGAYGTGASAVGSPADFNGAQLISGRFSGSGLQDLLYYYPSGDNKGSGGVLATYGDGTPVNPARDDAEHKISAGMLADGDGYNPQVVANAGASSGQQTGYMDLIGISGDATIGYHLTYYPNRGGATSYGDTYALTTPTPSGGTDWNNWTIATAQSAAGTTDMFLWNRTTGALYLWSALQFSTDSDANSTLAYTSRTLADGSAKTFEKGVAVTLRAADINRDGTPDLWTLGASAVTTAWIVTLGATSGTALAQPAQIVQAANHLWHLNDSKGTDTVPVTSARDSSGGQSMALSGDVTWNAGDMFDPDLQFGTYDAVAHTGTSTAAATTNAAAVSTTGDFTIGVWTKPEMYGGAVLSQDGKNGPGLVVWPSSDAAWNFAMPQSDATWATSVKDTAKSAPGTARLELWYHIVVSFKASTKQMRLYVNDQLAATLTHSTPWAAGGVFQIGQMRTTATADDLHYIGQIADVQTYNSVISPLAEPIHATWDHTRDATGVWPSSGQLLDTTAASAVAAAALPDGTIHQFTLVPGSGVWERVRSAAGVWSSTSTQMDSQGALTGVAAAALPNGTLHVLTLYPGNGVYDRTLSPSGTWSGPTLFDGQGALTGVAAAALPNGTLHVLTLYPGNGVYDRTLSPSGTWSGATLFDGQGAVNGMAAAGMPDGTVHILTKLQQYGIYDRTLSATGTFSAATLYDPTMNATTVSAAADTDGTLHVTSAVPGTGVWDNTRTPAGQWQGNVRVDDNATVILSFAVVAVDKSLHVGVVTNPG